MNVVYLTAALLLLAPGIHSSLSADVINWTLYGHNFLRNQEATVEGVANMNQLVWDASLAGRAARWAGGCRWGHEGGGGLQKGQNLYYTYPRTLGDVASLQKALNRWMAEKRLNVDKTFSCCGVHSNTCCHYTQVVSSKSRSVGCAVVTCPRLYDPRGSRVIAYNAAYVVCNYSPLGNVVLNGDARPYVYGQPCSQCPAGQTGCPSGQSLCV